MDPGSVASHVHRVIGGSNFGVEIPSSDYLRESECTSSGIQEDKSAYWFPQLYFEYANGSFELVNGGPVIYYLYPDQAGQTTIFPDDFRMISGNSATPPSYGTAEQRAVSFLCLDFNGVSTKSDYLPDKNCPSGVRAQLVGQFCTCPSNRLSHLLLPRTSKAAGTERTPTLPTTNLMFLIVAEDLTLVIVLPISQSTFPVSSTKCTTPPAISATSGTRPRTSVSHSRALFFLSRREVAYDSFPTVSRTVTLLVRCTTVTSIWVGSAILSSASLMNVTAILMATSPAVSTRE